MALYDGLAENSRRNERVDRGVVIVPGSTVGTIVLGPTPNASATQVLNSTHGNMRRMTHFELTLDGVSAPLATTAIFVSGWINTTNQTVGSIVYQAGTVLNINTYAIAGGIGTTAVSVRWTIWGNLSGAAGF